jgi:hypothetical protein
MGQVRRRGDHLRVSLDTSEVALVMSLASQLLELLGDADQQPVGEDSVQELFEVSLDPVATPRDPALLRLLPDAYRDDDEAASEFRRLTEADLRAAKHDGLTQVVTDLLAAQPLPRGRGVRLELDEPAAATWLTAMNDVRLALGTRIGVTEDMDDERMNLPVDSRRYAEIATYDWFSWLQDAMLRALTQE